MKKILPTEEIVDESALLSFKEFCELCVAQELRIVELVEIGILEPQGQHPENWHFTLLQVQRYKKAQRLQQDLKINLPGVALSLELLDQIHELESQIQNLEHMLSLAKLSA
jgi:chaperone modulatory protein CbpM